jgi:hypothetical protein
VVETTGYITLSLWDKEEINIKTTEITVFIIIVNPVILSINI